LIDFIEGLFTEETAEDKKKQWELKLNKEDIKVYVKKTGGSRFNLEQPYILTEITFNAAFKMNKVIQAVSQ